MSCAFIVACSFYTEGCDGGFPTLLGKLGREFYLATEKCFKTDKDKQSECSNICENSTDRAKIAEYGYLGGYYGKGSEANTMKEIRARGPIVGSFEPPFDFTYYKEGIYQKMSILQSQDTQRINDKSMRNNNIQWEKVGHSIVILGWGEEDGIKYWICQNSWDTNWGEQGYFRIKRGVDECAIESMPEFANPYFI